ncbi:hypothetical protein Cabther_B0579 [Chloracidobacterium thermophilum B]|jgi:hypothetical protein|uniref:Uncharacterized protein n=1 Tax=Chloracidobacterium thermophilum (strain B) TaxID=981222 RepID=G2LK90_CHLTF|nr:hypothetical protein Cabther_B0579 [Chloracidobacterium thermophilum B]
MSNSFSGGPDLKRLTQRLKLCNLLSFQFLPNLIKASDSFDGIQSFTAVQAYICMHLEYSSMDTTPEKFFYLFLNQFATTYRALIKRLHFFLLICQSIHRSGSGRYTVINTAHCVA